MAEIERRLHVSELPYIQPERLTHHLVMACKVSSTKLVTLEECKKAFKVLVDLQVRLRQRIVRKSEDLMDLWYSYMSEELIENDIPVTEENVKNYEAWTHIVYRDGKIGFNRSRGPLWRASILRIDNSLNFGLILWIDHAISDGISAFDLIYRQFLPVLSRIINNEEIPKIFKTPLDPCPTEESSWYDDLEEAEAVGQKPPFWMRAYVRYLHHKSERLKQSEKSKLTSLADKNGKNTDTKEKNNSIKVYTHSYSVALTSALVASAKEHNVTVHAILMLAMAMATNIIKQKSGRKLSRKTKLLWPINLRPIEELTFPQPLGIFLGVGSGSTRTRAELKEEVFWSDATNIARQLLKQKPKKRNGMKLDEKTMSNFLGAAIKLAAKKDISVTTLFAAAFGEAPCALSNLGLCDGNKDEPDMSSGSNRLEMLEVNYTMDGIFGFETYGLMSSLISACTFKGQLRWTCSVAHHWFSGKRVQEYMNEVEKVIRKVCSKGKTN